VLQKVIAGYKMTIRKEK